ncbi:MAG: PD-(D/E)XK nuclease family protein, partial [Actinomycetota bacterium]|nr:PD-(D/E)XK nuclease family protein [Actinomycetota bacterium]
GAYRELRDLSSAALDAIAARGQRAADVVRLHRSARGRLVPGWYDEEDLMAVAVDALSAQATSDVRASIGAVVIYLPQRLSLHAAALLEELAARTDVTVVAGLTGDARADAEVVTSVRRLGIELEGGSISATSAVTTTERTRFFTASDADEEVREAVRAVVDAARGGTPLDRMAVLHASPEPYDRLIREHLSAAGISVNGATDVPVAARLAGRTLLQLLDLPALRFRREDVFAWLTAAPVREGRRHAPVTAWERISREAGVVAGAAQWDQRLLAYAERLEAKAAVVRDDPDRPRWQSDKSLGDAERARGLRSFVLDLIQRLQTAAASPQTWSHRAAWARDLLDDLLGGSGHRHSWPTIERKAAERVELALDRLAALDSVEKAVELDVFSRTLAVELESDLGRVGRFGEGVFVGSVGMGVGLDLDLVILLGLAEGSFPAPVRDDSLLPDREREAAGSELALRSHRIDREHRELLVALAGSNAHLLGIPRGDLRRSSRRVASRWALEVASSLAGERWWSPDLLEADVPWVTHLASFDAGLRHMPFPATEQEHRLRELLAACTPPADLAASTAATDPLTSSGVRVLDARRSPAFTRFDGNLAGLAIPSPVDTGTSATSLERWAKCPQAYLVQDLLRVQQIENPEEELAITPRDRGTLIHGILETFFQEVLSRPKGEQPAPSEAWSVADRARMQTIAEEWCTSVEERGLTGRTIFWDRDRRSILRVLDRFLTSDDLHRAATGARPVAAELAFGMGHGLEAISFPLPDGRKLALRGKADRVDVTDDGVIFVVDYKTGKSQPYRELTEDTPDLAGQRVQLAVYAEAARSYEGHPDAPVEARYWFVSDVGKFEQLGYCVTPEVLSRVSEAVGAIVEGIERGIFTSHPGAPSTRPFVECAFCDPDGLGTGELRRQWERKSTDEGLAAYIALVDPVAIDGPGAAEGQP